MNKQVIPLLFVLLLLSFPVINAGELDDTRIERMHSLEDKMCMELYGTDLKTLKEESDKAISWQARISFEQRINNVEMAVQNYMLFQQEDGLATGQWMIRVQK